MDLRLAPAVCMLLIASVALAFTPSAAANACDTSAPDVGCQATVGRCDLSAGANVVTATAAGASADCRLGNMTRCYVGAGTSGVPLRPTVDRWCAF